MRAFLACNINSPTRRVLEECESRLKKAGVTGRWTASDGRHMTVLFLGRIDEQSLEEIRAETRDVCSSTCPLKFEGGRLATFGTPPRVLCAELNQRPHDETFAALATILRQRFVERDILADNAGERRRTVPHVTLCRFRGRRESSSVRNPDLQTLWNELSSRISDLRFTCKKLCLFESILTPQGAWYKQLGAFPLAAGRVPTETQD